MPGALLLCCKNFEKENINKIYFLSAHNKQRLKIIVTTVQWFKVNVFPLHGYEKPDLHKALKFITHEN